MYQALYRKWRPQTFADVVGQQAITTALQNQILADKIGHAYLFTGTRGTGKTTCAKIFAKAVNCENPNGANPCGECVPCRGIEDGSILDVLEIDAASNNGVDDIRDLRDETAYRPSRCKYKVYIIDEVHMLSTQAFNALLKIMEEPPAHVIFILATTEIHKVPATILSRCQRYDFSRIPPEEIIARLQQVAQQEAITLSAEAADLIARLADGALRDALSLLDVCAGMNKNVDEALVRRMAGVADKSYLFALSAAAQQGDTASLLKHLVSLHEQSIDTKRLAEELARHYRNLLLAATVSDGSLLGSVPQSEREEYLEAAALIGEAPAIYAIRRLAAALDKMGRSPDPRIELELALFDIANQNTGAVSPVKLTVPEPAKKPVAAQVATAPLPPAKQEANTLEAAVNTLEKFSPNSVAPVAGKEPTKALPDAMEAEGAGTNNTEKQSAAETKQEFTNEQAEATDSNPGKEMASSESPQPVASVAPAGEGVVPFDAWSEIVSKMQGIDRMLYSFMKDASAYVDGRRVLIDGGDMFLLYMREDKDAAERIKTVIEQVTGNRYGIGPYTPQGKESSKKPVTAKDTLRDWEAKGVPIEYK